MVNFGLQTLIFVLLLINEISCLHFRGSRSTAVHKLLTGKKLKCIRASVTVENPGGAHVVDGDLKSSENNEEDARLSAQSFFDDLRGTKMKVALSALLDTYYVEEMLQDGVVTKKQLTVMAQGKRQLNFELFYEICCALNKLQDIFVASDDYDVYEIAKQDEAKALFNELRGDKSMVSVTALKSLYYFEEMLQDGAITAKQFTDITHRKRQLDFQHFYDACTRLDALTAVVEELGADVKSEDKITDKIMDTNLSSKLSQLPIEERRPVVSEAEKEFEVDKKLREEDDAERLVERDIEEKKEIKVDTIIRTHFMNLAIDSNEVSVNQFKNWPIVISMLIEGVIDTGTVDNLLSILGFADNMTFAEFNELVHLLDDATGMGLIEVKN